MDMQVIWVNLESKYFFKQGWTGKSTNGPSGKSVDGRYSQRQRSGDLQYLPGVKCWSRAPLLFFHDGVTRFDQLVELHSLLSNPFRCSFFILRARRSGSLFDELSHVVLKYRDAVVEFR
jgi:hypothetical protein